jgi:hypothetical protein
MEPVQGLGLVFFLGPVLLRLDGDYSIPAYPLLSEGQQSLFAGVGQGGSGDVKTKVDGAGDLVDILPSGPAGANEIELDFTFGNG